MLSESIGEFIVIGIYGIHMIKYEFNILLILAVILCCNISGLNTRSRRPESHIGIGFF